MHRSRPVRQLIYPSHRGRRLVWIRHLHLDLVAGHSLHGDAPLAPRSVLRRLRKLDLVSKAIAKYCQIRYLRNKYRPSEYRPSEYRAVADRICRKSEKRKYRNSE